LLRGQVVLRLDLQWTFYLEEQHLKLYFDIIQVYSKTGFNKVNTTHPIQNTDVSITVWDTSGKSSIIQGQGRQGTPHCGLLSTETVQLC
jgi:hypothetical protein